MVEVARRSPQDAAALGRLRGLGNLSASAAQRLLDALARAADAEPPRAARELPPGLARRVAAASALGAVLVRARCEGAHIAPELVATRAELESFVEAMANGQEEHALLRAGGASWWARSSASSCRATSRWRSSRRRRTCARSRFRRAETG